MSKNKPLAHLSDEKKAKLSMLMKRFDLDITEIEIKSGPNTGHWVKNAYSGDWRVLKDKEGNLLWPNENAAQVSGSESVKNATAAKPKSPFNPEDYVSFINDPNKVRYHVKEVKEQPFGRTGFWCLLLDKYGAAAFGKKLIESAELEACPVEYWINTEKKLAFSGPIEAK